MCQPGDQILCFAFKLHTCGSCLSGVKIGLNDSSRPSLIKGLAWDARADPPPVKKKKKKRQVLSFFFPCHLWKSDKLVIWFPLVSAFAISEWDIRFSFSSSVATLRVHWFSIDWSANFVLGWSNSVKFDFGGKFIDLHGNTVSCHFPTLSASIIGLILHLLVFQFAAQGF